jgi:hypothetical protein
MPKPNAQPCSCYFNLPTTLTQCTKHCTCLEKLAEQALSGFAGLIVTHSKGRTLRVRQQNGTVSFEVTFYPE